MSDLDDLIPEAARIVVSAMSDECARRLLMELVSSLVFDCGDTSTPEQLDQVSQYIPPVHSFVHKVDADAVRAVVAVADRMVHMLPGSDNSDKGVRLAICAMRQQRFCEPIV